MLNGEKILVGLSGGINSMAVLCWLVESGIKPSELHLLYAHFDEHSPDTFQFVADGIRYARKHFDCVKVKITRNNVLKYFEAQKMIPHPMFSPCSRQLKIEVITKYAFEHEIKHDLIGYVKHELKRRVKGQIEGAEQSLFALQKHYPIGEFSDDWCFEIVDEHIGWHPAIYDLKWSEEDYLEGLCDKRDIGNRIFKHNNCLPCKNMYSKEMKAIRKYYPKYFENAMATSNKLKKHFGRDKDEFYATFGRDLGQESTCEVCKF